MDYEIFGQIILFSTFKIHKSGAFERKLRIILGKREIMLHTSQIRTDIKILSFCIIIGTSRDKIL